MEGKLIRVMCKFICMLLFIAKIPIKRVFRDMLHMMYRPCLHPHSNTRSKRTFLR